MRTFQHFLSYYKPYRKIFYLDLFCALMISVIDILFPLILDYLSNDFFLHGAKIIQTALPWIALGLLVIYAIRSLCRYYVSAQGHGKRYAGRSL